MLSDNALKPQRFDLMLQATERASTIVAHTSVTLGAALDAACRKLGIVLDDDSYAMAIIALGRYRQRQRAQPEGAHVDS